MIYVVNGYNEEPTYFNGYLNASAKSEAEKLLAQKQADILNKEAVRFSICATFVEGENITWREAVESDPEDIIYQVFDASTGQYVQCANKTEAYTLNEQKKAQFLESARMHVVEELEGIPVYNSEETIPVEVM